MNNEPLPFRGPPQAPQPQPHPAAPEDLSSPVDIAPQYNLREQIIENAYASFRNITGTWPINDANGKAFYIVIGKAQPGKYYAAVVYRMNGMSAARQWVRGTEGDTVEDAVGRLFETMTEVVHRASGEDPHMRDRVEGSGGSIETRGGWGGQY